MILSLTGSWSDRTGVVDIRIVQVAVRIDIEHISIAVIAIEVVRRERPIKDSHVIKKVKSKTERAVL